MKETLVRINAWITAIFYLIMTLVNLLIMFTEKVEFASIITLFMFLSMSATGWFARKFGLAEYEINRFSKPLAIISLIFEILFLIPIPIMFTTLFDFEKSYSMIITLFILFLPAVISAIVILFIKPNVVIKLNESKKRYVK